jgi:thioesterase domain-containing protein
MQPFLAVNKLILDIDVFNRQVVIYLQRWQEAQPQMKIIPIPTDHFTMLEPEYSKFYIKEL